MNPRAAPLAAAAAVLARHGAHQLRPSAAGVDGEVLLLRADGPPPADLLDRPALVEELRAAGFRYVALDLAPADAPASKAERVRGA